MADQKQGPEHSIMPSILDRELNDHSRDAFGHAQFAQALRNLIEAPHHHPPFSIGLLGPWGTGKSTIKELYLDDLRSDKTGKRGARRQDRIHAISFNAWRYGGESDIKRALLRDAFLELGGNEAALRRQLYQQVSRTAQRKRQWKDWAGEAFGQIAGTIILFLALAAGMLFLTWTFLKLAGVTEAYSWSTLGAAAIIATGFLSKYVLDLRVKTPSLFTPQTNISFPSTSAEEYEWLLLRQIERFRNKKGKNCDRLVIFVDDLDRLSAAEMVAGLDAIRTFLEMPVASGDDGFGVIFVISCDEDRVAEALARGRGRIGGSDLPGSVFTRTDARRYLDRLFQFRLEIPLFPKQDMRQFAEEKLRAAGDISAQLEAKGIRTKDVIDRLIHVDVQSPRNAIQLLNAFLQAWWISDRREKAGVGSLEAGVLHEGAVTDHPLSLAALSVLRVDFPDFYDHVQKRPELLHEFSRVVFGTEDANEQAEAAQDSLREFLVLNEDKSLGNTVKREYRGLRQYISSIQDLRWAPRLQPLLLLSEDPITRKFGDRAAPLNAAFVSGDLQGVLESLGRNLDQSELDTDDVSLLEGLAEEVVNDTPTRRTNAARVIAGLIDRIPGANRRGLVTPLARQMVNLKDVRMNVGPSAAAKIVKDASPIDRREVAEQFVADLLHGNDLEWRLPGGGEPNLDEATQITKDVVELAIGVRNSDGLTGKADSTLRKWLLKREVRIGGASQTLPFSYLSECVSIGSQKLLEALGDHYANQAIQEFQSLGNEDKPEREIQRVSVVHSQLAQRGQEARAVLWEQLGRMVSVKSAAIAEAAWETASRFADLAVPDQSKSFLQSMAARLQKDMEEEEAWSLDWQKGARQFNDLLTQWLDDIDDDTAKAFTPLIVLWGNTEDCEEQAERAINLLEQNLKPAWNTVIAGLLERDLSEMTHKTASMLAAKAAKFAAEHSSKFAEHLTNFANQNPTPEKANKKFDAVLSSLPKKAWTKSPWKELLEHLFNRCVAMHNQAPFVAAVFPSVATLFSAAPKGRVGGFLKPLFEQGAGAPDVYPILHKHMIGRWPRQDEQTGAYDADALAQRACQFINDHPNSQEIGHVFASVVELAATIPASAETQKQISGIAPLVWVQSPNAINEKAAQLAKILQPQDTARIVAGNQPANEDQSMLGATLNSLCGAYDEKQLLQTTKAIVGSGPRQIGSMPDGGLEIWTAALGDRRSLVLEKLLVLDSLNDDQHVRLLSLALSDIDGFTSNRFANLAPTILGRSDQPKTRELFIKNLDRISKSEITGDNKSALAESLAASSPSLAGDDLFRLCSAIRNLGGQNAFSRNTEILEQFDTDQERAVEKAMPGIRFPKPAAE